MQNIYKILDDTINKSAIQNFREYLLKYSDVTKWTLVSDYCLEDKSKPNNVVSFVFFPYIMYLDEWQKIIQDMQKTDLKKTRTVDDKFIKFLNSELVFSFNFILEEECCFDRLNTKEVVVDLIQQYINIIDKWEVTTLNNKEEYKAISKRLNAILNESKRKNFNYKLLGRIIIITFLAAYLKYLLLKEHEKIEVYSWLSDIDAITTWQDKIYRDIYYITQNGLCSEYLAEDKTKGVKELHYDGNENRIFYEQLNRVADFICGGLADFDYKAGRVSAKKHCDIIENIISDNEDIIIISIHADGMARVVHTTPPTT